ncbi:MAG: fluoride efflux transporter CrcB [Ignavibacteriota bacterium]
MIYLYLAIGSVAGALLRYQLGVLFTNYNTVSPVFPWTTFVINISGSFVLGFLMDFFAADSASKELRVMLAVGFCGSYTTFSTFSHECITLLRAGQNSLAMIYGVSSFIAGPLFYLGGYLVARSIRVGAG